jgi:hypothetical protein
MRKTTLLDPFITFQTITENVEEEGIDETADFRFGTGTSKLVTTIDKAQWGNSSFSCRREC